jgi:hypothetical protein
MLIFALLGLVIKTAAVDCTPPVDPNISIGIWRFAVGEDINQPLWFCGTQYDGKKINPSLAGLPAGLSLNQNSGDVNLPQNMYHDANDPQFKVIIRYSAAHVERYYVKGKLTKPIADATVTVTTATGHTETLIVGTFEQEEGISGGCK